MSRAKKKRINAMRRKQARRYASVVLNFLNSPPVLDAVARYGFAVSSSFARLADETRAGRGNLS